MTGKVKFERTPQSRTGFFAWKGNASSPMLHPQFKGVLFLADPLFLQLVSRWWDFNPRCDSIFPTWKAGAIGHYATSANIILLFDLKKCEQ